MPSFTILPANYPPPPSPHNDTRTANFKCTPLDICKSLSLSLYLPSHFLCIANDCHPNSGPRPLKYPCQICRKACKWSKTVHSITCTNCELWYHTECMRKNTLIYFALDKTKASLYCNNCGLPNFQSSLFEYTAALIQITGDASSVSNPSSTPSDSSFDFGFPKLASSPKKVLSRPLLNKSLPIVTINFQSMWADKEEFWTLLQLTNPDGVLCSETWL